MLDGLIRIEEYVEKLVNLNCPAGAITDHGVVSGAVKFYTKCKEKGIKPLIGMEAYIVDDIQVKERKSIAHVVLLAKNLEGYRNLLRLSSLAYVEGFYYKPRIDFALLEKYREGLICLSACLAGFISRSLLEKDLDRARSYVDKYLNLFSDDFYLEIQSNNLDEQLLVNLQIFTLAKEYSIPVVATTDAHYLNKEDAHAHRVLLAVQTKKTLEELFKEEGFEGFTKSEDFYVKTVEEMLNDFPDRQEVVTNTLLVAEKCDLRIPELDEQKYFFPNYEISNGRTPEQELRRLAYKGLIALSLPAEDYPRYRERLDYELGVIEKLGFATYFLVLKDIIDFCKQRRIRTNYGRGSAAGSLVSYTIGITKVDPLKYNLLFERFLNPDRVSLPDIDTDIEQERRGEVIQYLYEKYGRENVAHIGTYGTLELKAAIKDIARVYSIDFSLANNITKNLPDDIEVEDLEAHESMTPLREILGESKYQEFISSLKKIVGLKRHGSIHAAGIVLSPVPVTEMIPLRVQEGEIVTQFDMEEVEKVGLIKFDLLGLRTLSVVEECLRLINKDIDIDNIPFDDEKTWELLSSGQTTAVFQFESEGIKRLLRDMRASEFEDLVATNCLFRPGPLGAKDEEGKTMVEHYVLRKLGREEVVYDHPLLEPILKRTYGIITEQEQVMQIARVLAGYTPSEADELRKGVAKKKPEIVEYHAKKFVEGCVSNGIDEDVARKIWNKIDTWAGYGFNRSHGVSYSLLSYLTAYLKANYTVSYMTAALNSVLDKQDRLIPYLEECLRLGIEILPPDINYSYERFVIENENQIRFGLGAIKKVTKELIEAIIDEREKTPITSLKDLFLRLERSRLKKDALINLILAGAFDRLEPHTDRKALVEAVPGLLKLVEKRDRKRTKGCVDIGSLEQPIIDYQYDMQLRFTEEELETKEEEVMGISLTKWRREAGLITKLKRFCSHRLAEIASLPPTHDLIVGGIVEDIKEIERKQDTPKKRKEMMLVFTINDMTGRASCLVPSKMTKEVKNRIKKGMAIRIRGRKMPPFGQMERILVSSVQAIIA